MQLLQGAIMAEKSSGSDPPQEAKFVFRGTIQKAKASTMVHVPADDQVAIVHVDQIVSAPPALAKTLGQLITVKLAGAKPKAGEKYLFHCNGWLFGESIAVEAVSQEKDAAAKTMLAAAAKDPTHQFHDQQLEQRVNDADLVVEGEVSSVHLPQENRVLAAGNQPDLRPLSEHDPKWREAVIDVSTVHKGKNSSKQVVVRFPSSMDVQWHRAPKFKTGDRGVWLLHGATDAAVPKKAAAALSTAAQPGAAVYTALHPMDFQSAQQLQTTAPVILDAVKGG
jgi:hypothetical protein